MAIARHIKNSLSSSSAIRKLFEEGAALKKQYGADKVFDFSIGNPDVEPPAAFHEVFLRLAQEDAKGSHGYMPNAGFPDAREKIARKAGREHTVSIDGGHVVMAVGAAGGLNAVFKTILNHGDEVIVPTPYFMEYRSYVSNHNGVLIEVSTTDDFNLDVNAIRAKLSPKTAAILINSPHNPTGRVYPEKTLASLSAALTEHGESCGRFPYLVADEPYREIAYNTVVPPVLSAYGESIVVSSYSKSLSLPGERIGYIAVSPAISNKDDVMNGLIYATRVLGFVNAPALMQRIVAELTEERVDVEVYARRRDAFKQALDNAGLAYADPEGAFYLFVKAPDKAGGDDVKFSDHLKKHLILGVPGTSFGKSGWIRFAYCVDEAIIRASADAFKKAMETF
ncbi:MAG: pyridoxal phosphate-dependent aminotransferase [Treponema sp.]|jgi:aspartate aminotransferase|nr:pyridoxal phosphate-dependent aminotransferase [Treponema sp.]